MSVDIDGHFVTIYITKCYDFMSIKKVDKFGQKTGIFVSEVGIYGEQSRCFEC